MIKFLIKIKNTGAIGLFKKSVYLVFKWLGYNLLNINETIAFLSPYQIMIKAENHVLLPYIANCANCENKDIPVFEEREGVTDAVYVWSYEQQDQKVKQLPLGTILIDHNAYCTDFNHSGFYKSILTRYKRPPRFVKTLIAPWSQHLDGIAFGGYYDFVLLIAAKLCRIKDAMPTDDFLDATVSYPLFNTDYEQEYLHLIGIKPEKIVDSRFNKVIAERNVFGNSGHWFYPNSADILSLKKHVEEKLPIPKVQRKRIYISRSGRRQITNESELILLLKKFDFVILEDKPRSVAEQVSIYKNASFIIGPHGASFTNIIWCDPGTHLIELFSPNYVPDFYLYMANILAMKYSAYYYGRPNPILPVSEALVEDVFVSITDLEACLTTILKGQTYT